MLRAPSLRNGYCAHMQAAFAYRALRLTAPYSIVIQYRFLLSQLTTFLSICSVKLMLKFQGLLLFSFLFFAANAKSESTAPELTAKPARCIALRQGQTCYQKITFRLRTPEQGEYCLHRESLDTALICWRGSELQKYSYDFSGSESEHFSIVDTEKNLSLTKLPIRVAWVYKSEKRKASGWRLF